MRLLEHEAKSILAKYGLNIPEGKLVSRGDEITLTTPVVLKAQVPIGGRGKAGGVLPAQNAGEAAEKVKKLLDAGIRGYKATRILMEEQVEIEREFFMAITYDTVAKQPVAIFSTEGGVDIEELSVREPEKVNKELFTVGQGMPQYRAREIISKTGVTGRLLLQLSAVLSKLAEIFLAADAVVAEINPLALTGDGRIIALDCHLEVDDDALFRHPDLAELEKDENRWESGRSATEFERQAAEIDNLDHRGVAGRVIEFDGDLGLIIGGGGASLTAFDAIKAHGGKPANYCEIGGNPSVRKVKELTRLLLTKPNVKKVAVIMNVVSNTRVDMVARGIIKGILEAGLKPAEAIAAFRIPGAWEDEGAKILAKYGVRFLGRTVSIDEAARIAVKNSV